MKHQTPFLARMHVHSDCWAATNDGYSHIAELLRALFTTLEQLACQPTDVVSACTVVVETPQTPQVAAFVEVVHIERGAASELVLGWWLNAQAAPISITGAPL
jgi:hypothetical protein